LNFDPDPVGSSSHLGDPRVRWRQSRHWGSMEPTHRPLRQRIGSFFTSLTGLLTGAAALIGAVVAILTAVGVIGGGGDASHSTTTTDTQAAWTSKANAICAAIGDTRDALPDPKTLAPTDLGSYANTAVVLQKRMMRELNALPPPQDGAASVTRWLRIGAQMNDEMSELSHAIALSDIGGLRRHGAALSRLNTRFNHAAIAVGASTCAEGSSLGDVFSG
jgi:hypothetical protein